jgi:hypothetical protein
MQYIKNLTFFFGFMLMIAACSRAPDEQKSLKNFAGQMAEFQRGIAADEAEWKQRFSSLSMGNVLLPSNLVTTQGRASGKETLKQFRTLIGERADRRKDASNKLQQIIAGIPNEDIRDSARTGVNAHHEESVKSAEEMDRAQLQLADAYEAVINWSEREGRSLTVQENQLRLSTPVQQNQLDSLLSNLKEAEKREDLTVSRMEDIQRKAQRKLAVVSSQ